MVLPSEMVTPLGVYSDALELHRRNQLDQISVSHMEERELEFARTVCSNSSKVSHQGITLTLLG